MCQNTTMLLNKIIKLINVLLNSFEIWSVSFRIFLPPTVLWWQTTLLNDKHDILIILDNGQVGLGKGGPVETW
jgi:hypothetical protein